LESFLQLLAYAARERWGQTLCFQQMALQKRHQWIYRGQVIPVDRLVTVDCEIAAWDDARRAVTANGFLLVDGRVIYQMRDFTIEAL
jgi:3-hydroxymyristoyl/3-hydroxydecanoyl-(acyl carrier protein) dehydratase